MIINKNNKRKNYVVYWYHLKGMDIYTEGYKGITNNTKKRHKEHLRAKTSIIGKVLRKYGDNVILTILASELTQADALLLESKWLPYENIGWNICKGGGYLPNNKGENNPSYGKSPSPETRYKISQSNKGKKHSDKYKNMMSYHMSKLYTKHPDKNGMYGKHHSEESKKKTSESLQKYYKNTLSQILFNNSESKILRYEYLLLRRMKRILKKHNKDYKTMSTDDLFIMLLKLKKFCK